MISLALLYTLAGFAAIYVSGELLHRLAPMHPEIHRKYSHVLTGVLVITASYFLGQVDFVLLAVILFVVAVVLRFVRPQSLFGIQRVSYGGVSYAMALLVLALLWLPDQPDLLRFGIMILTIPDALAALIGSQWGKQIQPFNKSLLGSTVFAMALFLVSLGHGSYDWWQSVVVVMVLTPVEFVSIWGVDNLILPVLGTVLVSLL